MNDRAHISRRAAVKINIIEQPASHTARGGLCVVNEVRVLRVSRAGIEYKTC